MRCGIGHLQSNPMRANDRLDRWPMSQDDRHHWLAVIAPNGDRGYQCVRCRLTAISLPVPASVAPCPHLLTAPLPGVP